ncbi:solute carrier family 23 protein, partial [Staphylococcus epidermidis]|uniref:solute carrier family 23 protein n=1 Tax=Staphylococcus epidermidis TaxID=1282 RepID=UPI0037DA089E
MLRPLTLLIIRILQRFTNHFFKSIPILIPLPIPTPLPGIFPILHIKQLPHPHSFPFPLPFTFSPFPFHLTSILLFFILPVLTLIESTALYHPLTQITGRKLQTK